MNLRYRKRIPPLRLKKTTTCLKEDYCDNASADFAKTSEDSLIKYATTFYNHYSQ